MATRKKTQYTQFSKRLATFCMIFWGVYRLVTLGVALCRPSIASALTAMNAGVDDIASVVVISYCVNSLGEKVTLRYFESKDKERNNMMATLMEKKDEKEDDEKAEEEDDKNG